MTKVAGIESATVKTQHGCWKVVVVWPGYDPMDWWCPSKEQAEEVAKRLNGESK